MLECSCGIKVRNGADIQSAAAPLLRTDASLGGYPNERFGGLPFLGILQHILGVERVAYAMLNPAVTLLGCLCCGEKCVGLCFIHLTK